MEDKLSAFREQLVQAVAAFATPDHPLGKLLQEMAGDVARAGSEPLELFPVCHHSPASGLHLYRRLQEKKYKVLFLEMCEDMSSVLENLRSCRFPVALQAFSSGGSAFPPEWSPLNVVAPLTEFSAEYQAIAYAMENPDTKLVFVDRAVDYIFQWMPREPDALAGRVVGDEDDDGDATEQEQASQASHGSAIGLQVGDLVPTFGEFLEFLLKNARVKHFAEWWDQYVEVAVIGADYETYRQVLFLVGSLMRRLGRKEKDRKEDQLRERYMWTRMKTYLAEHKLAPGDALHICGAAHTASDAPEFGSASKALWDIPARTDTAWLFGVVPSSFRAIEHQFGNPAGTLRLAEQQWDKVLAALGMKPLRIGKKGPRDEGAEGEAAPRAKGKKKAPPVTVSVSVSVEASVVSIEAISVSPEQAAGRGPLMGFLTRSPALRAGDLDELLHWCVEITAKARDNGYLTSTADSIAIYQTSMLLAGIRNRSHPSPYDFTDAAITCLEKNRTPKKRDIARLCQILLGGDRVGLVGYASLPPLAQDVYDRLQMLESKSFRLENRSAIQRALMDIKARPELLPCSDLLWMLHYLQPSLARPIMGERKLGVKPVQESWDVTIGKNQTALINLGYEGVSVESVLEKRLKTKAYGPSSTTVEALASVEDAILFLKSGRLVAELGERSIDLLKQSTGASEAPQVFERVRRLVHYYRATPTGLPDWLKRFVTTGYSHYATLLPASFQDDATSANQVAAMLAFLFTLESLALAFGCQRSQLLIAVRQSSGTESPVKLGLLWSAEWLLGLRDVEEIRGFLNSVLENVMMLPAFPDYVTGFLLALGFTPLVGRLVVELLSKSFSKLPDEVLLPWLPSLLMALRPHAGDLMPTLLKEVGQVFPRSLDALSRWDAPWDAPPEPTAAPLPAARVAGPAKEAPQAVTLTAEEASVRALLGAHPEATDGLALLLGEPGRWVEPGAGAPDEPAPAPAELFVSPGEAGASEPPSPVGELLRANPAAMEALVILLG